MSIAVRRYAAPVAMLLMGLASVARAEAPQVKTQAPGYYRMMLGNAEITALYDGVGVLQDKYYTGLKPDEIKAQMAKNMRANPLMITINAFLVNTGSKLVLIDTGEGYVHGPNSGHLMESIKAAGYDPAQVDDLLITHLHFDHVAGAILAEGKAAFPKAVLHAPKKDADFWLNKDVMAKAPKEAQSKFKTAQDSVAPYQAAGRFKTFQGEVEVIPGFKSIDLSGHTPGMHGYFFEANGSKMLFWGDIVHAASIQLARPATTFIFDSNGPAAAATRAAILARAAKEKFLVGGAHTPFPGIGQVREDSKGSFSWMPADYAPTQFVNQESKNIHTTK